MNRDIAWSILRISRHFLIIPTVLPKKDAIECFLNFLPSSQYHYNREQLYNTSSSYLFTTANLRWIPTHQVSRTSWHTNMCFCRRRDDDDYKFDGWCNSCRLIKIKIKVIGYKSFWTCWGKTRDLAHSTKENPRQSLYGASIILAILYTIFQI